MTLPEDIYKLILDSLSGHIDDVQAQELKIWLNESDENKRAYDEICKLWYSGKWGSKADRILSGSAWNAILERHRKQHNIRIMRRGLSVAAAVVLIIGSVMLFRINGKQEAGPQTAQACVSAPMEAKATLVLSTGEQITLGGMSGKAVEEKGGISITTDSAFIEYGKSSGEKLAADVYNELIIPKCGEYTLKLADGSTVFLNSASRLRYPVQFNGKQREVYLSGEAYFEVAKDAKRPFIVHTEKTDVRVLGTEFNVMAYGDEENTEVTLVQGSVNVAVNNASKVLVPGCQMAVNNTTLKSEMRQVNIEQYIAWKKGLFSFDAMPLEQLMRGLSRWYNISYVFRNNDVKTLRFTGGFKKTEKIEEIFRMIEKVTDVDFTYTGNDVVIN